MILYNIFQLLCPCGNFLSFQVRVENIDQELLEKGMLLYDALYSWAKYLQKETHTQQPSIFSIEYSNNALYSW